MTTQPNTEAAPEAPGDLMFRQVIEAFVSPEVERRRAESGELEGIHRFLVLMPPGDPVVVKLNREFQGEATVRATRDFEQGEEIDTDSFDHVSDFRPDEIDRGRPFIAGFAHRDGWSLVLRLGWQHVDAAPCLRLGQEFAVTAREALAAGRTGPALENAHSAAELFAKAVLLSAPPAITGRIVNSSKHTDIVPAFNQWTALGNAPRGATRLLGKLQALRRSARYLNDPLTVTSEEVGELFEALDMFEKFTEADVAGDPLRSYFVIATRELRAGELVELSAMTTNPHDERLHGLPRLSKRDLAAHRLEVVSQHGEMLGRDRS